MSDYKFNNLSPFKFFILETFPFIQQEYFDAMNEWQMFCKVGEKINEIINSQNSVGQETESLYNAFINLQNYINNYLDNLDIQEEVNNKLNDMAESGELSEIITQYLQMQGLLCYDNLEALKNAENLAEGSFIKLFGYSSLGDGITYYYNVRQIVNTDVIDDLQLVSLTNYPTLVAERISSFLANDKTNPIFYGADPTGTIDSSTAINNCILANKGGTINFSQGNYLVNQTINLPYNQNEKVSINGNGAKLINTVTLDRLFYIGFDKGLSGSNDVGFPSYIKDLFIEGDESETTYCIDIIKGYKDLKIFNCKLYRFLNGVRIGESTGSPADILISDCLLYGKGSEFDGTGVIANCTDNNINMCRIYGYRKGFIINGTTAINLCQVLLRWKDQTSQNFNPYEPNSTEWNSYYNLTMFAEINAYCRCLQCYGDSVYKFLEINTQSIVSVNSCMFYNARNNVNNRLFDFNVAVPKFDIDNCNFEIGSYNEGEIIHRSQIFNNASQIKIGKVLINNIERLTNPADIILSSFPQYISNISATGGNWYVVKILSNNSDYNNILGNLIINGYEYKCRFAGNVNQSISSIVQCLKGSGVSNWSIGTVTVNGDLFICVKPTNNANGVKFDFIRENSSNLMFDVTPVKNNQIHNSSRLLSDYTNLVPTNEIVLNNVLF